MQLTVFRRYEYFEALLLLEVNRYRKSRNLVLKLPLFHPPYMLFIIYMQVLNMIEAQLPLKKLEVI
jgi:hypothetical protein